MGQEDQSWVMHHIKPVLGMDEHNCGQLVKLFRDKSYVGRRCSQKDTPLPSKQYAIAGWEIQGMGRQTMNIFIASFAHDLLGAAFPTTGIPETPTPRMHPIPPHGAPDDLERATVHTFKPCWSLNSVR